MGEVGLQGAWWAAPGWTFLSSYSGGGRGEEEEDEEKQLVPGAALLNAHAEPVMWHFIILRTDELSHSPEVTHLGRGGTRLDAGQLTPVLACPGSFCPYNLQRPQL